MEYRNGELDNIIISLMEGDLVIAKGRVISGDTAGIFLNEVGFLEDGTGVKNSYSKSVLTNYKIVVHNEFLTQNKDRTFRNS